MKKNEYRHEAFLRNIGLLSQADMEIIKNKKIAIAGLGGVGGIHLVTLIRMGFEKFHIADFDRYEVKNVNRQYGAKVSSFDNPKIKTMIKEAKDINPYVEIKPFPEGVDEENIGEFLDGVSVYLDSLDFFSFDVRRMVFNKARENKIFVVTAGPIGFSSAFLVVHPEKGMSFDEYFNIDDNLSYKEKLIRFTVGLSPSTTHVKYIDITRVSFANKVGPSMASSCQLCAGLAATEIVKIVLDRGKIYYLPHYIQIDPYVNKYIKKKLYFGNKNPFQRLKIFLIKRLLKKNEEMPGNVIPPLPEISDSEYINEKEIRFIFRAGIQAPSGDNIQPWKFEIDNNKISIFVDDGQDDSIFNHDHIPSVYSMGCAIENMRVAASYFHLSMEYEIYDGKRENGSKIATVSFKRSHNIEKDPLFDSVWRRCVNRKAYNGKKIPREVLKKISSELREDYDKNIRFVFSKNKIKQIFSTVFKGEIVRVETRDIHEYLFKMIRFSKKEAIEKRDGFPLKNLEAGFMGELSLRFIKSWRVMKFLCKIKISYIIAFITSKLILNSSGIVYFTLKSKSNRDIVEGGIMFQRLLLLFSYYDIAVQPFAGVPLLYNAANEKQSLFKKRHQKLLKDAHEDLKNIFPFYNEKEEIPVMILRFGYAPLLRQKTYRRRLRTFYNVKSLIEDEYKKAS